MQIFAKHQLPAAETTGFPQKEILQKCLLGYRPKYLELSVSGNLSDLVYRRFQNASENSSDEHIFGLDHIFCLLILPLTIFHLLIMTTIVLISYGGLVPQHVNVL